MSSSHQSLPLMLDSRSQDAMWALQEAFVTLPILDHIVWERMLLTPSHWIPVVSSWGRVICKLFLGCKQGTEQIYDLCMPVGIYICTQITCYILPSFNLHLFLLIQHVLSGWDYRREHERAEVLAMQLASPHSQRRQHIINRNFINWWQTAIATWNCLPKPKSGMNEQRSLL